MPKKAYTPEQILNKLREAEILLNQGATVIGTFEGRQAIKLTGQSQAPQLFLHLARTR